MAVSPTYRTYVLEQLSELGSVAAKSMFGGLGLYHEGWFFGLVDDDTLYLKVDALTRSDYEAAGMEPFRPAAGEGPSMGYYEVPGDVLEDPAELGVWAAKAVEVARRKAAGRTKRPKPRK
ncbi:MAG TPA: TfoX/Sxy family protein [Gemmatimonadales bacterium]|nr:TfoX/Sxy family protein [Gemmatimonadales bacterium]